MKSYKKSLLTLAIMFATAPAMAATLNEVEVNNPIQSAQSVNITDDTTTINAAIGVLSVQSPAGTTESDLDYYSFYAQEGDVITLDIDGGIGGVKSVDTILGLYDANYHLLRMNSDASSLDPGSTSVRDARIDNFRVPASGIYYAAVSAYPRFFINGGIASGSTTQKGDYQLVISGVSTAVKQINIEIKPGSDELAPMNPKSKGKVPVALLSDSTFNALDVDPATVTFGATGNENSLSKCDTSGTDVNGDGNLDLVCHFSNQDANFQYGDLEGIVRGKTRSGVAFEGHGLLKVVPH